MALQLQLMNDKGVITSYHRIKTEVDGFATASDI